MDRNVHVLLVGSLGVDELLVRSELERGSFRLHFGKVSALAELEDRLESKRWDIVIIGLENAFIRGLELIRLLKQTHPELPLIAISGVPGEMKAVGAMKAGADDYLLKDDLTALLPALENLLSERTTPASKPVRRVPEISSHLTHSLKDVIFQYDIQRNTIWIQDSFGTLFEDGESELDFRRVWNTSIERRSRLRLLRYWAICVAGKSDLWRANIELRLQAGNRTEVESRGYIVRSDDGKPERIIGVLVVVPDPGKSKADSDSLELSYIQRLLEKDRIFQFISEKNSDVITITSARGEILFVSNSVQELLGLPPSALLGKIPFDIIHPDDTGMVEDALQKHQNHDCESYIVFRILANGAYKKLETFIRSFTDDANQRLIISASRDITQRDRWIEEQQEQEKQYRTLFEGMREGVIVTNIQGEITQANSAAVRLVGMKSETDIIGNSIAGVLFEPCACLHHFDSLQESGYLEFKEITLDRGGEEGLRHMLVSGTRHPEPAPGRINFILSDITSLKHAQVALKESERRLRGIVSTARVVILLLTPGGKILEWNREAENVFGTARESAIGMNFLEAFVPVEESDRVRLELARIIQGRSIAKFETSSTGAEQKRRLLQWSATALTGELDNASAIVAIGTDVTDKRIAERELVEKEANLSAVIENTEDSIWSIDVRYRVRTINTVFQRKFKALYGVELTPGMRIIDYVPEPIRSFWLEKYDRALAGESYSAITQFNWKGEPRDYEISFNPMYEESRIIGISIFARDITERVSATNALKYLQRRDLLLSTVSRYFLNVPLDEMESKLEDALRECSDFANAGAAFLAVLSGDVPVTVECLCHYNTVAGESLIRSMFESPTNFPWWLETALSDTPVSFASLDELPAAASAEKDAFRNLGIVSAYILPLRSQGNTGAVLCFAANESRREWSNDDEVLFQTIGELIANVLDRKRAYDSVKIERMMLAARVEERTSELRTVNAELARAARMKDEFLANMSHELRTPLTAILGLTESLQEQISQQLSHKQRNALSVIDESGRHLLSLINDILDLSKIEAGHLTVQFDDHEVDLLCKSSLLFVRQMAMKKNVEIEYKNPDHKMLMRTDGTRLKQVLVNLLNNAVKFTPEGGKISLLVKPRESKNEIEFEVRDTGIGIDERNMSQLFKPFVQLDSTRSRQYEGTGLGLALVASLTDMLGGSVAVESAIHHGSRFIVTLPFRPAQIPQSNGLRDPAFPVSEFNRGSDPPVILLAEDNESNIFSIQNYLKDRGFDMHICRDGFEVLDMLHLLAPDLILLDIQLPGMAGTDTIRRIREVIEWEDIPIIALTALAMPGDKERCLNAGADDYLLKPLSLDSLCETILRYLKKEHNKESA